MIKYLQKETFFFSFFLSRHRRGESCVPKDGGNEDGAETVLKQQPGTVREGEVGRGAVGDAPNPR